jgi:hypothetical protein
MWAKSGHTDIAVRNTELQNSVVLCPRDLQMSGFSLAAHHSAWCPEKAVREERAFSVHDG